MIEMLVTGGVFLLVTAILAVSFWQGSAAWRKVDRKTELIRELQIVLRSLQRDLTVSDYRGIAVEPNSLSYLSNRDAAGEIAINAKGNPIWQSYVLVYLDSDGVLWRRLVPRATPDDSPISFAEETGSTINDFIADFPDPKTEKLTHAGKVTGFKLAPEGELGSLYSLSLEAVQINSRGVSETAKASIKLSLRNR